MPREAPVTSAVFPSRDANSGKRQSNACSSALSDLKSLTEITRTPLSILFSKPLSTLPGPTSTKTVTPLRMSSVAACVNFTGAVSCSTSSVRKRCAVSSFAVTVDTNGASGSLKWTFSTVGRSRSAARSTSGLWNAPETRALTARPAPASPPPPPPLPAPPCDRAPRARDDDLPWTVVVRRPHVLDLVADRLDRLVGEAEDRRHRARPLPRGSGHREATLAHQRNRLSGCQRLRRRESRELANGMTDDEVRLD